MIDEILGCWNVLKMFVYDVLGKFMDVSIFFYVEKYKFVGEEG